MRSDIKQLWHILYLFVSIRSEFSLRREPSESERLQRYSCQPLPGYPGAYSPDEMAARWAAEQAPDFEERCKKAKAAYDARNPHKKEGMA